MARVAGAGAQEPRPSLGTGVSPTPPQFPAPEHRQLPAARDGVSPLPTDIQEVVWRASRVTPTPTPPLSRGASRSGLSEGAARGASHTQVGAGPLGVPSLGGRHTYTRVHSPSTITGSLGKEGVSETYPHCQSTPPILGVSGCLLHFSTFPGLRLELGLPTSCAFLGVTIGAQEAGRDVQARQARVMRG